MYRLLAAVDDTGLDQFHHAVGEHLRVDTEILLIPEFREYGIRQHPGTYLYGRSVMHELGSVPGYRFDRVVIDALVIQGMLHWIVHLYELIYL